MRYYVCVSAVLCVSALLWSYRFYFRNWHGVSDKEPAVYWHARNPTSTDAGQGGTPLLEQSSLEYLFAQVGPGVCVRLCVRVYARV